MKQEMCIAKDLEIQEVKRSFMIDERLLQRFKQVSKANSKSYKQSSAEALELWLAEEGAIYEK